jgi:integrase
MPVELRDINKTLRGMKDVPPEEKEKLKKKMRREAKEWRAENCWAPNRLRHTFGTLARREAGIEAARVTLGHSSAVTSEIYAERDLEAAKEIVKRIG